jgi:urease accessory protein
MTRPQRNPAMPILKYALAAVPACLPHAAWAHHAMDSALPQTLMQGLLSGLGHPLIGLDHAAFIIAAGFALALAKGGMWGVAALIAGSLCGALLHLAGSTLPVAEAGIALSVLLAGALVLARRSLPLPWLAGGLALAGVLHGHAYAESIFGAEATPLLAYLMGFSLMQLGIAAAAFAAHRHLIAARASWHRPVSTSLGAVTAATGALFLALNIAG